MKNKIENLITGFKGQTFNSSEESIDYLRKHIGILLRSEVNEIIKLSDKIEMEGRTEFNEWRAFKGFRNTLRDKYE